MSHVHEYRVRPVNRFVLTEYIRHDGPGQNSQGSPRTVAELPNAELANELGQALQRANPGSTLVDSEGAHTPAIESATPHTNYPSRYAIGARVMRCATATPQVGVGQHGVLHDYDAEEAEILGVHFYVGKVCYDVTFPSGRAAETVDAVELSDLPGAQASQTESSSEPEIQ